MKALTLWQPWASLMILGYKINETRSKNSHFRGEVAIHAAKYRKLPHEIYERIADAIGIPQDKYRGSWLYDLEHGIPAEDFGAVLGTVTMSGSFSTNSAYADCLSERERALGDYSPGRFVWQMSNPTRFEKPISAKGNQGWWNWEPEYKKCQKETNT